jgi:hypothetical protein
MYVGKTLFPPSLKVPTGVTISISPDSLTTLKDATNAIVIGLRQFKSKMAGSKLKGVSSEDTMVPIIRNERFILSRLIYKTYFVRMLV